MTPYHEAVLAVARRYQGWFIKDVKLRSFVDELVDGCENGLPINKLNRWLGYVQGMLIAQGMTTVQKERDWTRKFFRPLDYTCSTCGDTKEIDQCLGGEATSGIIPCPDCPREDNPVGELRSFLSDLPMQHLDWERVEKWLSDIENLLGVSRNT